MGKKSLTAMSCSPTPILPTLDIKVSRVPRPHGRRETAWYDCLRMRAHSQKKLGICLHLEIVSKINTYMSDIFPCNRKIQPFASLITFNSKNVEDNHRVYKGKDAFLWLPTSFGRY